MSESKKWTTNTVWPEWEFPLEDDLESLNKVAPDGYRYVRNDEGRYTCIELEKKISTQ